MRDLTIIEDFRKSWGFARTMTLEFVRELPEDKWNYTPHEKYAPLCKQFRHMIWVTGLYREAMLTGEMMDCECKKIHYSGELDKEKILKGFEVEERKMKLMLKDLESRDLETFSIKAFGIEMKMVEFTSVFIQHESTHQGLWSFYATLGGFPTPVSWQQNWGI